MRRGSFARPGQLATGSKTLPTAVTGWSPLPRLQRPVPWEAQSGFRPQRSFQGPNCGFAFSKDAIRAFGHHMFHGSHQLARLNYAQELQGHVDEAREEAKGSGKPNAAAAAVNEMQNRMDFIMNPTGGAVAHTLTSAAFVYHLSASPAAALVNLSQVALVGVPILAATMVGRLVGA